MTQISVNTNNKLKITLDVIIAISALVLLSPPLTGNTIHEWLGLVITIPLLVHLLLNWDWIVDTTRRFFGRLPGQTRINYILNWVFFILITSEGFSGLMISKTVLPMFGLSGSNSLLFKSLHQLLPNIMLLVLGLHLAMNWKWVLCVLKKNIVEPLRRSHNPIIESSSPVQTSIKTD